MAIAVEQTLDAGVTTGNISFSSWGPGAYDFLLVAVAYSAALDAPTVAGNGLTWTPISTVTNAQGVLKISMFWAQGMEPSSGAITITFDANTANAHAVATRFSGVANVSPVEATATDAGPPSVDNNDMKVNITTLTDNAWVIAGGSHRGSTLTVPGGQTAININKVTGTGGAARSISMWYMPVASPNEVTVGGDNCLSSDNDWSIIAISVKLSTGVLREIAASMVGQATTSDVQLSVQRNLGVSMAGETSLSAAQLRVVRSLSALMAGQINTSSAVLQATLQMSAIMRASIVLPNTVTLRTPSIFLISATMNGRSTVAIAKLSVVRSLSALMTTETNMPIQARLRVVRNLSALMATETNTSIQARLRVIRSLSALMAGRTQLPIQAHLRVLRSLAALMTGRTRLPNNVVLIVITSTVGFLRAVYALRTPKITAKPRTPRIFVVPRER